MDGTEEGVNAGRKERRRRRRGFHIREKVRTDAVAARSKPILRG
jgi:hypothetical protein